MPQFSAFKPALALLAALIALSGPCSLHRALASTTTSSASGSGGADDGLPSVDRLLAPLLPLLVPDARGGNWRLGEDFGEHPAAASSGDAARQSVPAAAGAAGPSSTAGAGHGRDAIRGGLNPGELRAALRALEAVARLPRARGSLGLQRAHELTEPRARPLAEALLAGLPAAAGGRAGGVGCGRRRGGARGGRRCWRHCEAYR